MSGKVLRDGAIIDPSASAKLPSPEGKPTVTVLDYGSGNVRSAVRALERAGAEVILSAKPEDVLNADGLVVPGVGAFETVMRELKAVDGIRLIGRRVAGGRPVLGICVGLQVLFEAGVEHGTEAEGMRLGSGDGCQRRPFICWCIRAKTSSRCCSSRALLNRVSLLRRLRPANSSFRILLIMENHLLSHRFGPKMRTTINAVIRTRELGPEIGHGTAG